VRVHVDAIWRFGVLAAIDAQQRRAVDVACVRVKHYRPNVLGERTIANRTERFDPPIQVR
jgi:hypothetical protein